MQDPEGVKLMRVSEFILLLASLPGWALAWVWGESRILQCPKLSVLYANIPRKGFWEVSSPPILWDLPIYHVLEGGLTRRYCPGEGDFPLS